MGSESEGCWKGSGELVQDLERMVVGTERRSGNGEKELERRQVWVGMTGRACS